MVHDRWAWIQRLFEEALRQPAEARAVFLDEACGGDAVLRTEVESLLACNKAATGDLLPSADTPSTVEDAAAELEPDPFVGRQIGEFHIVGLIAAGGMGRVYEALQEHPRRTVALKVMKRGIASRSALRRFAYETQTLGRLRHPGIAQIYHAGTWDDGGGAVPYFAMEYVPNARPLTDYSRSKKLGIRRRLELFATVCDAVDHGHQKGIIHRDLKPANILVDASGQPKVIDFGLARATDSDMAVTTLQTEVGQLLGTLQYMSPEQCEADPHDLDTRSDVYSLGVVLYELLCGRLPYDLTAASIPEAARMVRDEHPARPSSIDRMLRGDVETIALKALEKDREQRYRSAADLGEDIRRSLRNEPILARPPSLMYQFRKVARRNRAVVSAAGALFLVLLITSIAVSVLWVRADRERGYKEEIANDALNLFGGQLSDSVNIADGHHSEEIARALIEKASDNLQTRFKGRPEVLVRGLADVARAYERIGDLDLAEMHLKRALEIATQALGDDHPVTLEAHAQLGSLYRERTDHKRAEAQYLEVIATFRRSWPKSTWDPRYWEWLSDMYHDLGRCAEAEALLREAMDVVAHSHPDDAASPYYMTQLAGVYRTQKRYDEARRLLGGAVELCRRHAGAQPVDPRPMRELARLHLAEGRLDEALSLQQQALDAYQQQLGEGKLDRLLCVELGASIDLALGRVEQAESGFASAAEAAGRSLSSENRWWAANFRVGQASCLMRRQRHDLAEPMLLSAYADLHERLGDMHHRTQNCIRALRELYEATGQPDRAAEWQGLLRPEGCQ